MRRAMAEAEVGDDVFGDDPTVNALEERAAELLGKEAGLFVASGTMGNLVAQLAHLGRGQETIAGREHHLVIDEAAGHAVIVGTSIRVARGPARTGRWTSAEIEAAFRDPSDPHEPITGLVDHREHPRPLDGPAADARLHARRSRTSPTPTASRSTSTARASGTRSSPSASRPTELAGPADTVTFCLSKGLACPVGSVVVGSRDVIWRARRAPQAGRRRDAPGRDPRRGRPGRPVRRPGRHDRAAGRGPRQRPPPGRGPGRDGRDRRGRRDGPARRRVRSTRAASGPTSSSSGSSATGPPSSPPSERGAS